MTIDIPKRAKVIKVDSEFDENGWKDTYSLRTPKGDYRKLLREPPTTDTEIVRWFRSMKVTHVALVGGWHATNKSKLYTLKEFAQVLGKLTKEAA